MKNLIYMSLFISLWMMSGSSSMWSMWLSLEIYNFFLIPWMYMKSGKLSKDKIFKYYVIQFTSSSLFMMNILYNVGNISQSLMIMSMIMKLGGFPFHMWMVVLLEGISWKKVEVLLILSKLSGLMILYMINPCMSSLVPYTAGVLTPLSGLKTSSVRKLFSLSSVSHMSWMFIIISQSVSLVIVYFVCYWLILQVSCKFMDQRNINSIKDFLVPSSSKLMMILLILFLMGFPPFLGFLPKLLSLKLMSESNYIYLCLLLGVCSIFPMYMYMKLLLNLFTLYDHWNSSYLYYKKNFNFLNMYLLMILSVDFMFLYWI